MNQPVEFGPPDTPTSQSGWSREWAVASRIGTASWSRGEVLEEAAARTIAADRPGAVVISREVLGWNESPVRIPSKPYDGSMDTIVADIIAEEHAILRGSLERGADIAITHMENPRGRVAHLIACPSLGALFERPTVWAPHFRERLMENRAFRVALPHLATRGEARQISGVRSCKTCWPNIEGSDAPPLRELSAEGLRSHHVGKTLATATGTPLGVIQKIIITRSSDPDSRFAVDSVTITTDQDEFNLQPRERVFVLTALVASAIADQESKIRLSIGIPSAS